MKTKMKKLISSKSIPILTLALLAGVVLMTGIAWAKSTEYSVNCEFTYGGTFTAKQWIDDEGVLHLRGITYDLRGTHDGIRVNHTEGYSSHVYQGIGGDFVGWKLRLNGTWNMDPAVKAGVFEGILHNPHGE